MVQDLIYTLFTKNSLEIGSCNLLATFFLIDVGQEIMFALKD